MDLGTAGHDITVFDENNYYGGHFYIGSFPPFKQRISAAIGHYVYMCDKYGVKFKMGAEVTKNMITDFAPDTLIISTGSEPLLPPIKGIDNEKFSLATEVLLGKRHVSGKALIIGGGLVGVETAEYVSDYCDSVAVVEMADDIAPDFTIMSKTSLLRRFKEEGVLVSTGTKVKEFFDDGILAEKNGEAIEMRGYDSIVLAMGAKKYNPFDQYESLAKEVYVVGDAKKARSAVEAIFEAAMAAIRI